MEAGKRRCVAHDMHINVCIYINVNVPTYQVQFIDGRFKSFSCRSSPNELPVVTDSLGGGHGA